MFTVILLSDSAKKLFERFEPYFAPFEEEGLIAFCEWNQAPGAVGLQGAVPQLPDVIQGKPAWRALVVDHPRSPDARPEDARDVENPFDFVDNHEHSLNLRVSKHALIRLAHTLLGYPQMTAKSFRPLLQYKDSETGRIVKETPRALLAASGMTFEGGVTLDELSDDDAFAYAARLLGDEHTNVRRIFEEESYTEEQQQTHAELVELYKMNEVRPSEVILVSTRAGVEADEKLALQKAWNTNDEQQVSRFVERNDYPPMCRFAVYELLEEQNSGYEQDLLHFWLAVLTLSTNLLPPGGFQADRLYRLDLEFGKRELGEMLNQHLSKLAMVRDHLQDLIQAPAPPPSLEVSNLLQPVETPVEFESLGGAELEAPTNGYGLARDKPRDEYKRWVGDRTRVASEAATFTRKPRRAVARSVLQARSLAQARDSDAVSLDEIERDELQDQLTARLRGLVVPATSEIIDPARMQRAIARGDTAVRAYIGKRMNAVTIAIATAVALGVWIAAFVPYLIQSTRKGTESLIDAGLVVLIVIGIVFVAGLIALFAFRRGLLKRIQAFNSAIGDQVCEVRTSASMFAEYLSEFVTYRRGASRLRGAQYADVQRQELRRRLRRTRDAIVERIEDGKEIVRGLDVPITIQRSYELLDYDPNDPKGEQALFRLPRGERKIPFNDSGEFIDAPYDFISALRLHRIALYEREPLTRGEVHPKP